MVHHQFLAIDEVVKNSCGHWLHTPYGSNNPDVDVSHVRVIHCEEDKTHDSEKETALNHEPKHVHPSDLSSNNEILVMPPSFIGALYDNMDGSTKNGATTDIKYCGYSIHLSRQDAYNTVCKEKVDSSSDRIGQPFS